MAYKTTPYIPQVYDRRELIDPQAGGRLADLARAQASAQARGIRESGAASAQMWGGLGQQASGVLSQLAQYSMDAPKRQHEQMLRDEQAGKIRKEHNFEGVERMAGEGGLDDTARADLYDQSGFHSQATQTRDSDRKRKAEIFQQTEAELGVQRRKMSEALDALHGITQMNSGDQMADIAQKQAAYNALLPSLKEAAGKQFEQYVPMEYDDKIAGQLLAAGSSRADKLAWQQQAAAAATMLHSEESTEQNRQKYGRAAAVSLLRSATDKESFERAWTVIDGDKSIPDNVKQLFPREFSGKAMQSIADQAEALNPDKTRTEIELNVDAFRRSHDGRAPDQNEMMTITRQVNSSHFNPNTGAGRSSVNANRKAGINKEKNNKLYALEKQFREGTIDEAQLTQGKEAAQQWYLDNIGAEDGPTMQEYEADRGRDLMGKSLNPGAKPPVGPQQPPQQAPPRGGVLVQSPDGKSQVYLPQDQADAAVKRGATIVNSGRPQPTAAAPAAPAPSLPPEALMPEQAPQQQAAPQMPPPPQMGSGDEVQVVNREGRTGIAHQSELTALMAAGWRPVDEAPASGDQPQPQEAPRFTDTMLMVSPRGNVERVAPAEIEARLAQHWKLAAPPKTIGADTARSVWSQLASGVRREIVNPMRKR